MENEYYKPIDYELLDKKTAYKGKRITVEELHYKNPRTEQIIYREHVLAGHAAVIIPETDDGEFIMIKEPRTPIGKTVIAFLCFCCSTLSIITKNAVKIKSADTDVYSLGVGGRYYFSQVGIYLGANVNVDRWDWGEHSSDTKFSFGMEAGYAFFLSKTVALEPAVYWNINGDRSKIGLKLGFALYF